MAEGEIVTATPSGSGLPEVRRIAPADIRAALAAGIDDFRTAPGFGLLFGGLYTLGGLALVAAVTRLHLPWLAYPLAAGFALIGPFIAVGLYEVSRRIEAREPLGLGAVLGVVLARATALGPMAFVTLFLFLIWMYQVRMLLALFLGFKSFATFSAFLAVVFGTPEGLMFLAFGHVVGAALAMVVFSVTVVSIPMLLEREVDFITAMITSVKAVVTSPVVMLGWGLIVAAVLVVASLPLFVGLIVALPVLGHATWHLYRRAVPSSA